MKKKNYRCHVELFAGCGGLSLGLERAGYKLEFASEVSPMASLTFTHNILNAELDSEKTVWIHSRFARSEMEGRKRENLLTHMREDNSEVRYSQNLQELKGKLLIGDVRILKNQLVRAGVSNPYNDQLDLLSGGPPCQSFSLAGKREKNNYKNSLPLDYAEVCEILNPKVVVLENVKGILSPFTVDGQQYFAWFEVAKVFATKGWVPLCMLINSKYFGVPQNRPRYIMIGLRLDVFRKIEKVFINNKIVESLSEFMKKVEGGVNSLDITALRCYDIEKDHKLFDGKILPKPVTEYRESWINVRDAIGGLGKNSERASDYTANLKRIFNQRNDESVIHNHELRNHKSDIKRRFRFYQLLNYCPSFKSEIIKQKYLERKVSNNLIKSSYNELIKMLKEDREKQVSFEEWAELLGTVELTKKHSQRALLANSPAPAQLTIPDDICHYSLEEPRVLTVREIARIQSFPDWFEFKGKVTTGGKNRSFEVPQYTQVGNAVPPLMARELGLFIDDLLNVYES